MWRSDNGSARDLNAIGSILLRTTDLKAAQLEAAVAFKNGNPDVMLGEAIVRLGFIERAQLEAALQIQVAAQQGGLEQVVQLAIDRTRATAANATAAVAFGACVIDKLTP